jgi:hypothetical protein
MEHSSTGDEMTVTYGTTANQKPITVKYSETTTRWEISYPIGYWRSVIDNDAALREAIQSTLELPDSDEITTKPSTTAPEREPLTQWVENPRVRHTEIAVLVGDINVERRPETRDWVIDCPDPDELTVVF